MTKTKTFILFAYFTLVNILMIGQNNPPSPTVSGFNSGQIEKDSLLLIKTIDVDLPFKIISFKMIYLTNETTKEFVGYSNVITKEMQTIIQKCKTGDRFSFEAIKATDNKGILYALKPITFKIK